MGTPTGVQDARVPTCPDLAGTIAVLTGGPRGIATPPVTRHGGRLRSKEQRPWTTR